jgi:hypothetical protein
VPNTAAVSFCVSTAVTSKKNGLATTETPGCKVIVTVPDLVESATLIASITTVEGDEIVPGAL